MAKKEPKEPEIVITGEQIENAMAICNKHGIFDDFFINDLEGLEIDEYPAFQSARAKLFTEKMTDDERNAWNKFVKHKARLKSIFLLNSNISKDLWNVLGDGKEYNIETSPDIIIRGLAIIKGKVGL